MDLLVALLFVSIIILFLSYFLLDVNYFIRSVFTIVVAKFFRTKIKFLGPSEIYGIVLTTDADLLLTHMNNARTFREFDFCRWDHMQRSGMLSIIWRRKATGVVSAQTCRYRQPLNMFMAYKIVTRPAYYDEKSIYFEHKVISLHDGIVRCIAYVKLTISLDLAKVVVKYYPTVERPAVPKDLELWMEYIRVNSEKLKSVKKPRGDNASENHKYEEDSNKTEECTNSFLHDSNSES